MIPSDAFVVIVVGQAEERPFRQHVSLTMHEGELKTEIKNKTSTTNAQQPCDSFSWEGRRERLNEERPIRGHIPIRARMHAPDGRA